MWCDVTNRFIAFTLAHRLFTLKHSECFTTNMTSICRLTAIPCSRHSKMGCRSSHSILARIDVLPGWICFCVFFFLTFTYCLNLFSSLTHLYIKQGLMPHSFAIASTD